MQIDNKLIKPLEWKEVYSNNWWKARFKYSDSNILTYSVVMKRGVYWKLHISNKEGALKFHTLEEAKEHCNSLHQLEVQKNLEYILVEGTLIGENKEVEEDRKDKISGDNDGENFSQNLSEKIDLDKVPNIQGTMTGSIEVPLISWSLEGVPLGFEERLEKGEDSIDKLEQEVKEELEALRKSKVQIDVEYLKRRTVEEHEKLLAQNKGRVEPYHFSTVQELFRHNPSMRIANSEGYVHPGLHAAEDLLRSGFFDSTVTEFEEVPCNTENLPDPTPSKMLGTLSGKITDLDLAREYQSQLVGRWTDKDIFSMYSRENPQTLPQPILAQMTRYLMSERVRSNPLRTSYRVEDPS